uniref:Uncharacterized protein n=1 Tax=Rhizophora mucronata TaxID=61149 RepID=A0A2P2J5D4_RHIMU
MLRYVKFVDLSKMSLVWLQNY